MIGPDPFRQRRVPEGPSEIAALPAPAQPEQNGVQASGAGSAAGPRGDGGAAAQQVGRVPEAEPILCGHCGRTATNGISCEGICVADSGY